MTENFIYIDYLLFQDWLVNTHFLCLQLNIEPSHFLQITTNNCCARIFAEIDMHPLWRLQDKSLSNSLITLLQSFAHKSPSYIIGSSAFFENVESTNRIIEYYYSEGNSKMFSQSCFFSVIINKDLILRCDFSTIICFLINFYCSEKHQSFYHYTFCKSMSYRIPKYLTKAEVEVFLFTTFPAISKSEVQQKRLKENFWNKQDNINTL